MASSLKSKASGDGGREEKPKKRKVAFAADVKPTSYDASECIKLHIVLGGNDLQEDEELTFDPEFAGRIFGEDGKIHGYSDLQVHLWMHAATFNTYVEVRYESKIASPRKQPTDVIAKLKEVFGDALTDDRNEFLQNLSTYSRDFQQLLKDHGEVICSWNSDTSAVDADNEPRVADQLNQILRLELTDPAVRAWHKHLDPLGLFCIEGAQPVQSDDPQWEVYLAIQQEAALAKVMGFCNVFRFYHYPDSSRLRISQILVLPPYQGGGFGLQLLKAVNGAAAARKCYDVTMEEPSLALCKLRDTMDVLRLLTLPSIQEAAIDAVRKLQESRKAPESSGSVPPVTSADGVGPPANGRGNSVDLNSSPHSRQSSKEKSLLAPPAKLVEEVREVLQINKLQFKRCFEQIMFLFLDPKDTGVQDAFGAAIVQRLNVEIFDKENKMKGDGKRLVNTENDYDSSKTFIMMRLRKSLPGNAENGNSVAPDEASSPQEGVVAFTPGPEEKGQVLREELKEREDEMLDVARAVARFHPASGVAVPLLKNWEQGLPGSS